MFPFSHFSRWVFCLKITILDNMAITGTESLFYIKDDGIWKPISCEVSSPMTESTEMLNTTTRDNAGWKTERATMQMYSISIEAVWEDDNYYNSNLLSYYKLREKKRNRELIEWKRETFSGLYVDSGQANIVSISDANTVEETITFSMELSGFGKPNSFLNQLGVFAYDDETIVSNDKNNILKI